MARITVEDCLKRVNNRFALIHMAAKRVRQLRKGAEPMVASRNRDVVIALREIAAGNLAKAEGMEQHDLVQNDMDEPLEEPKGEAVEEAPDEKKRGKSEA